MWTLSRARESGYDLQALHEAAPELARGWCPLCKEKTGDIEHRLWHCSATEDLRKQCFKKERYDHEIKEASMWLERQGWVEAPDCLPPLH